MSLIRLGILRGGPSDEYDLSLENGTAVRDFAPADIYQTIDIFVDKNSVWHIGGLPCQPANVSKKVDVIFNALHGAYGEDGKVQSILDQVSIPYTGSSSLASSLTHHKHTTKKYANDLGIKTPYHTVIEIPSSNSIDEIAHEIFKKFPLPIVIKPVSSGSSYGVTLARSFDEIFSALSYAYQYSSTILVEEYIAGTEIFTGFIDGFRGSDVYHVMPIEVDRKIKVNGRPSNDFNYHAPAQISQSSKDDICAFVEKLRAGLGLKHSASFDFILSPRRGAYLLEIDSNPPLTAKSLFPKSLDAAGIKVSDYIHHLVTLARFKN